VEKYCRAGQATDDNMAHAHCVLDTYGYKYRNTEYVMLIAFPLEHWLHECNLLLYYMHVASLFSSLFHAKDVSEGFVVLYCDNRKTENKYRKLNLCFELMSSSQPT
jgi:hypothetical protein